MVKKYNAMVTTLRRAYARERRTIAGIEYTIAYYVVDSLEEYRKLLALWRFIGADTMVSERVDYTTWECELRFPRKFRKERHFDT